MSGTRLGALKLKQTLIEKHGSEEAYKKFMSDIGKQGGKKSKGGGVTGDSRKAQLIGSLGGKPRKFAMSQDQKQAALQKKEQILRELAELEREEREL